MLSCNSACLSCPFLRIRSLEHYLQGPSLRVRAQFQRELCVFCSALLSTLRFTGSGAIGWRRSNRSKSAWGFFDSYHFVQVFPPQAAVIISESCRPGSACVSYLDTRFGQHASLLPCKGCRLHRRGKREMCERFKHTIVLPERTTLLTGRTSLSCQLGKEYRSLRPRDLFADTSGATCNIDRLAPEFCAHRLIVGR
jgi:hypothetical protein